VVTVIFATWLNDWLILRKGELRPRTVESYQDLIDRYVIPSLGNVDVADLRADALRHLLASIVAAGHGRTAELLFVMLKSACADLDINPMLKVKRPKHHQQSPAPWPDEAMAVYLAACIDHPHGLALSLGLLLGLRRGEICGLRWQAIDLTANTITIDNQRLRLATGEIIDAPPKSASSIRTLPIPDQLRPWLVKARGMPTAYLCPLTPSGLDQAHRKLVARLGLPHIPLHGLRHTMATASLRHGGDMRSLQSILGHASYSTTANIYTHPDLDMLKSSLDAVSASCYTV
jgi:integrase